MKKPRAPRKKLTAEEAAAASEKREAKKKWKESLVNWTQDIEFKWPPGTLVSLIFLHKMPTLPTDAFGIHRPRIKLMVRRWLTF